MCAAIVACGCNTRMLLDIAPFSCPAAICNLISPRSLAHITRLVYPSPITTTPLPAARPSVTAATSVTATNTATATASVISLPSAGSGTSGQVLVFHDVLGMYDRAIPSFAKKYADVGETMTEGLTRLRSDFEQRVFPTAQHSTAMKPDALADYRIRANVVLPMPFTAAASDVGVPGLATVGSSSTKHTITAVPAVAMPRSDAVVTISAPMPGLLGATEKGRRRRIVVIGGGAMGSLMSGKLSKVEGNEVFMVTNWDEHLRQINETGLHIHPVTSSQEVGQLTPGYNADVIHNVCAVSPADIEVRSRSRFVAFQADPLRPIPRESSVIPPA